MPSARHTDVPGMPSIAPAASCAQLWAWSSLYFVNHAPLAHRDLRAPFCSECERVFFGRSRAARHGTGHGNRCIIAHARGQIVCRSTRCQTSPIAIRAWPDGRTAGSAGHTVPFGACFQATCRAGARHPVPCCAPGAAHAGRPVAPTTGNTHLNACTRPCVEASPSKGHIAAPPGPRGQGSSVSYSAHLRIIQFTYSHTPTSWKLPYCPR